MFGNQQKLIDKLKLKQHTWTNVTVVKNISERTKRYRRQFISFEIKSPVNKKSIQ